MSGITTTGATIITDLDNSPKSILLWRAIMQWLGGIRNSSYGYNSITIIESWRNATFKMEVQTAQKRSYPELLRSQQ